MTNPTTFIATHTARVAPLFNESQLANWAVATTGTPEASQRSAEARRAWMEVYAERDAFAQVKQWHDEGRAQNPLEARILQRLYLAYWGGQDHAEDIQTLTELMREVYSLYVNFRAHYQGRTISDNALGEVLRSETDSEKLQEAWEASKQVGVQVEGKLKQLARQRNAMAQRKGFKNFYEQNLVLSELSESLVFGLFDELEQLTREPFRRAKAELDAQLSQRFHLPTSNLRPWHYMDPFFQEWPHLGAANLDAYFADKDAVALSLATYDGIGLDVRDVLARSDLYERAGKNQHAFCANMDRQGDVRILCNLKDNERWVSTNLHELGHAVYEKYCDAQLPFLLRTAAHSLSTEAIALLMGRLTTNEVWLREIAQLPQSVLSERLPALHTQQRHRQLLFARWVFVMSHFERALYADPEQDLNRLWWGLVERFQMVQRPEGRDAPDWAAKYHIANAPAMYHNYLLGELNASQLTMALRKDCGGVANRPAAGQWLRERVFRPGASADWNDSLKRATGEYLSGKHFVEEFVNAGEAV